MTKHEPESELDTDARSVKTKPPLISLKDADVNELMRKQHDQTRAHFREKTANEQNVEVLRGTFVKYVHMLRAGMLRDLRAQRTLNYWSRHASNIQALRRVVEVLPTRLYGHSFD